MKKKNLKIGLIVLLVMLMLGLTYTSFAFWDQLTKTDDITVNIGEGKKISFEVTVDSTEGTLIPNGMVKGPGEVYFVEKTYTVSLDNETAAPLNLSVTESNVLINAVDTYNELVNITITQDNTTIQAGAANNVEVNVKIELLAPATEEVYSAIFGKPITFTLTFEATVAP